MTGDTRLLKWDSGFILVDIGNINGFFDMGLSILSYVDIIALILHIFILVS